MDGPPIPTEPPVPPSGLRARCARILDRPIAPVPIAWVAWLAWTVALFAAVRIYGADVPFADDYGTWTGFLTGERHWTAADLRTPHNGHRLGAALVLMGLTYAATGSSILAMLYLNAVLLSATAALFLWAVRRWRGHLVATDTLIPVVLLNWGHLEIVLWAMCVHWTLFLVCLGGVAVVAAGSPSRLTPGAAATCAVLLLIMTQSFGAGLVVALILAPWLLVAAWPGRDDPGTSPVRRATARCTAVVGCAAVLLTVAASWPAAGESTVARPWGPALVEGMPHVLANMFGCLALDLWHALPMPAVLLTVSALVLVVRRWWTTPQERMRLLAFGSLVVAFCLVALGTSRARQELHPIRYGTLMAVPFVLIYAVWSCCGRGRRAAVACWTLCLVAWITAPWNSLIGESGARFRHELNAIFVTQLKSGMPVGEFARVNCVQFPPDCGSDSPRLEHFLRDLHRARIGMFVRLNVSDRWPGMDVAEPGGQ